MTHKDFERDVAELEASYVKNRTTIPGGISTAAPEKPVTGDMWFNKTDGSMHVYMGDDKGWLDIKESLAL